MHFHPISCETLCTFNKVESVGRKLRNFDLMCAISVCRFVGQAKPADAAAERHKQVTTR